MALGAAKDWQAAAGETRRRAECAGGCVQARLGAYKRMRIGIGIV